MMMKINIVLLVLLLLVNNYKGDAYHSGERWLLLAIIRLLLIG